MTALPDTFTPPITPALIDTLAGALAPVIGDASRIVADAAIAHPSLSHQAAPDVLTDFVGRVLERCVALAEGAPVFASRTQAADAALAAATARSVARWPTPDAAAAAAWTCALNLFAPAGPVSTLAPFGPRG